MLDRVRTNRYKKYVIYPEAIVYENNMDTD